MNIGKRIRQIRLLQNLRQDSVANALGMSPGNYGKIERGEVSISMENMQKIARYLDVPLAHLIAENQVNESSPDYGSTNKEDQKKLAEEVKSLKAEIAQLKAAIRELQEANKKTRPSKK